MDLTHATRMILAEAEAAALPALTRVTREAYDELAAGRQVSHTVLGWMIREASRKDLYGALIQRYGTDAFHDMVIVVCREIDRQAPVLSR